MAPHLHLRPPSTTWRQIELGIFIVLLVMIGLRVWFQPPSALEQLTFREELQVVLVDNPLGRSELAATNGHDQLELDLLHGFARELGTRIRVTRVETADEAHRRLREQRVDLAAGLLVDPADPAIKTGPEILAVEQVLAFWRSNESTRALSSLAELPAGARLGLTAQSPLPERLKAHLAHAEAARQHGSGASVRPETDQPDAEPFETLGYVPRDPPVELVPMGTAEALRQALAAGEIDYALMNSLEFGRLRRLHPELRTAYGFEHGAAVTWLFPSGFDQSLIEATENYINRLRENRDLELMIDRYLGHLEIHDLVDALTFAQRVENRLDRFRDLFERAGEEYGLDWRFIAAVAYQESHWNADAISPTGVRGLMMLTQNTASGLGVEDRTDPASSVDGGTRYLLDLRERLPDRIPEPDRTWMTLAAYNVGLGHLHDARRLADAHGDDPDRWLDVMHWLPRLAEPEWYEQTRYGYARGWEPVVYVQNIRSYYDKLIQRFPESGDHLPPPPELYRRVPLTL
ncbi:MULTISPECIES: membrane-bound lytic murein transglycosylase MltF [unclassified Thioalkalivibrio]|uniref:membrane-bound lytic murein transglycosylase MltF n=1 Tax=unclassified Thioalkalivibrio TaxID=2621013 RepID=UPI0004767B81|nr:MULTISPECIES: membrane-bound lytic murein transglycosylase MltF [unclassified Thioalkalivibrio]